MIVKGKKYKALVFGEIIECLAVQPEEFKCPIFSTKQYGLIDPSVCSEIVEIKG